jgi:hypothetical protein
MIFGQQTGNSTGEGNDVNFTGVWNSVGCSNDNRGPQLPYAVGVCDFRPHNASQSQCCGH